VAESVTDPPALIVVEDRDAEIVGLARFTVTEYVVTWDFEDFVPVPVTTTE
jgi:hypothetical protein